MTLTMMLTIRMMTPCSRPELEVSVEGGGDVETDHDDHGSVEDPGPA